MQQQPHTTKEEDTQLNYPTQHTLLLFVISVLKIQNKQINKLKQINKKTNKQRWVEKVVVVVVCV
jgi:hypothetical protein